MRCNGTIRMIFEGKDPLVHMMASARQGTNVQVFLETKASISESITTFHVSTYGASKCDLGINHRKQSE